MKAIWMRWLIPAVLGKKLRTACVGLVMLVVVHPWHAASDEPSPLRFAPIPMSSKAHMTQQYLPFLDDLETHTGQRYELAYHARYTDLLDSFAADEIDFAYLGPLPYVALTERVNHATPVAQFLDSAGEVSYTCSLVAFAGHQGTLATLRRGAGRIALTQPLSTCGYLMVNREIERRIGQSLESYPYAYTGSHAAVALGVIMDDFALGGMKTLTAEKYHHLGLRVLAESAPVPGFLLVANARTVSPATIEAIKTRLISLDPKASRQDRETMRAWPANLCCGAVEVQQGAYDEIRAHWRELGVDLLETSP